MPNTQNCITKICVPILGLPLQDKVIFTSQVHVTNLNHALSLSRNDNFPSIQNLTEIHEDQRFKAL